MRATTPELASFLASRPTQMWVADLFTFTLLDGTVIRWSGADVPVAFGGNLWTTAGPALSRSTWQSKETTDVPEMAIVLSSTGTDYNGGNIKLALHDGLFDGAVCQLDRAIGPTPGAVLGLVTLFQGPVGQIEIGAVSCKITVKGWMIVLQQYMPRNTYQLGCIHSLYDPGCALSRGAFTCSNVAAAACTKLTVEVNDDWLLPDSTPVTIMGDLLYGALVVTSGPAAGTSRTVVAGYDASPTGGSTSFAYPLYATPNPGDTLTCTFGCDKTLGAGGCAKFSNQQHNRSFPYIPPAVQAV